MKALDEDLVARLRELDEAGLRRFLRRLDSPQGPRVEIDGRWVGNFSSNDYLGFASHPRLREAAAAAVGRSGAGAGASRLICGNFASHEELEASLARFKQTAATLTFSTGYAAALGTIPALVGEGDVVILDKLCHACLIDGARLSGAAIRVFPHNDLEKLESHLRWAAERPSRGRILVIVESIYSMDGDAAPLADIVELKEQFGAWLFLDEAHGVGVVGREGRGLVSALGLGNRVEIQMGTLGKALGASGAYIAGSETLRDWLVNRARSFIFSTAPSPPAVATARAAVDLLNSDEGREAVARLAANRAALAAALGCPVPESAIVPLIIGPESDAMAAASSLLDEGFLVPAIRFPTVKRGSARLRVTVNSGHSTVQIADLAAAVSRWKAAGR